ncbi:PIN domain-containing protein [Paludisphaera borealis]|uniref:DUF4935 domain-containing protein n=1 Tax=Paludisphaera borealis TaxID=1387353 RepID=A0A1U7CTY3_9BACT|nr:PIN domain-containing protein [Paludisphaera borealis]APW62395.1 hypothetical protein BSF38_03934 [Paludisphaera borealis]
MHLFLDSNIWLSFYHYSSDELEELRKLGVLIERKQVTLHVPDQVRFEFRRNREVKFADAISKFKKEGLDKGFPQIFHAYEEDYRVLRDAIDAYEQAKGRILQKLERDYRRWKLKADGIISDLFAKAENVAVSEVALAAARMRVIRGNPPGKDNSHGDAINWECLLEVVPSKEDLYMIAEDKDFREKGSDTAFSPFLAYEWKHAKESEVRYYRRLSTFFKERYPHIQLATELEKELLIDELSKSGTFKTTRRVLNSLSKYSDFTSSQINEIAEVATRNEQVYWIGKDADIKLLMGKLIGGALDCLDAETKGKYDEYFSTSLKAG